MNKKSSQNLVKATTVLVVAFFSGVKIDVAQAASNLIQNGDFETGDLRGWFASGNVELTSANNHFCCKPSEGKYFVDFNGANRVPNGQLFQTFSTETGTEYLLDFDFAKAGTDSGIAQLEVEIAGTKILLSEIVSDSTGGNPGDYDNFSFLFTGDSTSSTLTFKDRSNGTFAFDALIDNVSVTAVDSTPVPEPLTILGSVTALGFGALLKRECSKRKNKSPIPHDKM